MVGIGFILVLLAAVGLGVYIRRTIVRTATLVFQVSVLVGLTLMFIALVFFVQPVSSDSCSGLAWALAIGFTLALATRV
jgi:hypothetical protein